MSRSNDQTFGTYAQNIPQRTARMALPRFALAALAVVPSVLCFPCQVFPTNHILNTPIDSAPVHARSADYINSIGFNTGLHPDFGAGLYDGHPIGIPFNTVTNQTAKYKVLFEYASQSDKVRYPIPSNPKIEGSSDRHLLMINTNTCMLYELYAAQKTLPGTTAYNNGYRWKAGSGAVFDLNSYNLRPAGWTSADAAGLPIFPLLVRREEVAAGAINHAIRFTADVTRNTYVWPARHQASYNTSLFVPPMGQRFRLKASFNITGYSRDTRIILKAMKKYGIILADNGSDWYISGEPNNNWVNDDLVSELKTLKGKNFEAVDVSGYQVSASSGQSV